MRPDARAAAVYLCAAKAGSTKGGLTIRGALRTQAIARAAEVVEVSGAVRRAGLRVWEGPKEIAAVIEISAAAEEDEDEDEEDEEIEVHGAGGMSETAELRM